MKKIIKIIRNRISKMHVQTITQCFRTIVQQKKHILNEMHKVLKSTYLNSEIQDYSLANPEKCINDKKIDETVINENVKQKSYQQSQQKLGDILTSLRKQLWSLTQKKQGLVEKRFKLLEDRRQLQIQDSLQCISDRQKRKLKTAKTQRQNDCFQILDTQQIVLLKQKLSNTMKEESQLKDKNCQLQSEIAQDQMKIELQFLQIRDFSLKYNDLQQSIFKKETKYLQLKRAQRQVIERQLAVEEQTRKKLQMKLERINQKENNLNSLSHLQTKVEKMNKVRSILININDQFNESEDKHTHNCLKARQLIQTFASIDGK